MLCLVTQSCPTLCVPIDHSPPDSCLHGDSPGNTEVGCHRNTGVGCHALTPGDLPNPGIKPRSPVLQAESLPLSQQGSPTGKLGKSYVDGGAQNRQCGPICVIFECSSQDICCRGGSQYYQVDKMIHSAAVSQPLSLATLVQVGPCGEDEDNMHS